jgi:hypothetical protein
MNWVIAGVAIGCADMLLNDRVERCSKDQAVLDFANQIKPGDSIFEALLGECEDKKVWARGKIQEAYDRADGRNN